MATFTCAVNTAICSSRCRPVLQRRRDNNLLGRSILGQAGFDFDIDIHLGAGAYICGEESALIESLEGKRGVPRNRPPFPVTHGYLQQPTAVDNVETFCSAALAIQMGAEKYRAIGTAKSTGSKLISVSGDCPRPGIYEYPFGVSVREVLQDCGAVNTRAVQVSGPSGVCVAESEFDRKLGFEDLPTAGRSWCSTTAATCSKWRATSCISSRTRAAVSARRAASAPRC